MWKCAQCGEASEDNFDSCWSCGTGRDGTPPVDAEAYTEQRTPTGPAFDTEQWPPTGPAFDSLCPICGGIEYTWDGGSTGQRILERRCDDCGNIQLFDRAYLLSPPALMTLSNRSA